MSKGWKMVRLSNICVIQAGGTPSRGNLDYWKNGEIPWIKIGDIKGKYTSSATEFITKNGLDNSSAKLFKPNTILYTIFATIGEVSILNFEAATNQAIAGIEIIDDDKVNIDFIYYYLQSIKQNVISISRGIAQNNINLSILKNFDIPLPSLEKQLQIATTLDKASELITLHKKQLEELDALAESVFYDMFGDPVKNEKGYGVFSIESLCKNKDDIKCGPFGTQLSKFEYVKKGVPLWGIPQINSGFTFNPEDFLTEKKAIELDAYSIIPEDIVMSRKGNVGKCSLYPKGYPLGIMHSDVLRIRFDKQNVNPVFSLFQLRISDSISEQIKLVSHGAIMAGINVGKLKKIEIFLPPIHLQTHFASIIEKIEQQKALAKKALQESEDLFQRLMQDLFKPD